MTADDRQFTIQTNWTPRETRILDENGTDISADVWRLTIDVHEPSATVELETYERGEDGKILFDHAANEIKRSRLTGKLAAIGSYEA